MKYRIALEAEFNSNMNLEELGKALVLAIQTKTTCGQIRGVNYTTFEIEQVDYPEVNIEEL